MARMSGNRFLSDIMSTIRIISMQFDNEDRMMKGMITFYLASLLEFGSHLESVYILKFYTSFLVSF